MNILETFQNNVTTIFFITSNVVPVLKHVILVTSAEKAVFCLIWYSVETDDSWILRPGACITKVNRVNIDFTLIRIGNCYPSDCVFCVLHTK